MTKSSILIQPMCKEDTFAVATIMVEAFRKKFLYFKDWPDKKIANLFVDANLFNAPHFSGLYTATINGEIAGVIQLIGKGIKSKEKSHTPSIFNLIKNYGFKIFIQGIILLLMAHKSNHDLYVDSLAVSSNYRSLGVGTALLEYGKQLAIIDPMSNTYTLTVIGINQGAKRLYERFGFKVIKTQSNWVFKKFLGFKSIHYMSMNI